MLLVVNYLKISLPVNFILRQMRGESFWLTPFGESFWWVILKRAQIYSICNSRCIAQVLDCLAHIHTNNVIHRDLKVAYNPIYWKKCVTWWSECVMWYRHVSCDVSSACLTVSGHIFIVFKSLKMWNSGTLFEKRACLTVYHTGTRLGHTLCQSKIMVDAEWTLKKFIFSNRKLILIFFCAFLLFGNFEN